MVDRRPLARVCDEILDRHTLEAGEPDSIGRELVTASNVAGALWHLSVPFDGFLSGGDPWNALEADYD
jgi:hypothetical protein